jgi:hypothetical protein
VNHKPMLTSLAALLAVTVISAPIAAHPIHQLPRQKDLEAALKAVVAAAQANRIRQTRTGTEASRTTCGRPSWIAMALSAP